ncbi:polyphosphate kinase 2 family protein [Streptomyces celluloflavus]|uniref:hypothetical protein n=1 Tax=Streptomyces celluloflavus TaxID=58344 RepID=UPI0036C47195
MNDPTRRRKLSEMDLRSISRWEVHSAPRTRCSSTPTSPNAPWYAVGSDDTTSVGRTST